MASNRVNRIVVASLVALVLQILFVEPPGLCEEICSSQQVERRFVAWKFNPATPPAKIDEIIAAFKNLKNEIPDVISIEAGINNSPEGFNKGLTHGFIVTFPSVKARDAYLIHPSHIKFRDMVLPFLTDGFSLDFLADTSSPGGQDTSSGVSSPPGMSSETRANSGRQGDDLR